MDKKVVVIGNGIAALSAIERIRQVDPECKIVLFGQEPFHTYNRLKLSKNITTKLSVEEILIKQEEWYKQNQIEYHLSTPIIEVDFAARHVVTVEGQAFSYTHLLLANGSHNYTPLIAGIDLDNVFSLRTFSDTKEIQAAADELDQILIIGGGLLGLEMAWEFCKKGKKVSIVELFPHLLPRQLDYDSACFLEEIIVKQGVDLYLCQQVAELLGEDRLTGFRLKDDHTIYPAQLGIYSTGIRSNIDLFKNTKLAINKGIIVNQHMQTNIPNVYAAGDVCEYNGRIYGLWAVARNQGGVAGANIVGESSKFIEDVSLTNIQVFGQQIMSIGEINGQPRINAFSSTKEQKVIKKLFLSNGQVKGAVLINDIKQAMVIKKAINAKITIPEGKLSSFDEAIDFLQNQ